MRDGLIARNPAALVKRPGVGRREARHLDADDVATVLRAAESSRYHPALVLIASTGLRRGECLALSWDRVDLDTGALRVAATIARVNGRLVITEPKTDRARRRYRCRPPWWRCCAATAPSRRPSDCAQANSGRTPGWCSPPSSAGRWTRATCFA